MINNDLIQKKATIWQTFPINVWREYVQHLFLDYFYQQPSADKILFKGGTALRLIFNSPRFSEDLDFSSSYVDKNTIEDILENVLLVMERVGIITKIEEAKTTSGGYLAKIKFTLREQNIILKLEISLRKRKSQEKEMHTIVNPLGSGYNILALPTDELVSEKVQAFLTRAKPRDYYDLYFIIRARLLPSFIDLEKRIKLKNIREKILEKVNRIDSSLLKRELKSFLPKSHHIILNDFKSILKREMERT